MGSPESLAESHPNIIYNMCVERFGIQEKKTAVAKGPSRRQKQVSQLRAEIKKLNKTIQSAPEEEKEAIKELQRDKLRNLRLKKRAESLRKNRRKFRKNWTQPPQWVNVRLSGEDKLKAWRR